MARGSLLCASLLLAACATPAPAPMPALSAEPARDWVGEIRAAAAASGSVVQVLPLAEPAPSELRQRAAAAMTRAEYDRAAAALEQALALAPDDPVAWQELAEARVGARRWDEAERAARRSFELGPKLGELCARNWFTVLAAGLERGDAVAAAAARAAAARCQVAPPVRL